MKFNNLFFRFCFRTRLSPMTQVLLKRYHTFIPLKKPIFVIGLNRSGTSITTELLSNSEEIVNWSEANQVWDPVGYPFEANQVARPFWAVDPKGYTESLLNSVSASYFEAIPGLFSMYVQAQKGNRKEQLRFLNKSPMNATRIEFLYQLFPDAYFLSIVRDPRAVISSWLNKIVPKLKAHPISDVDFNSSGKIQSFNISGKKYSYLDMMKKMAKSYNYVVLKQLEDSNKLLDKEKIFYTRYEDLSENVHGIIRAIDQKFNLDSNFRNWEKIPEKLESRNYKYKDKLSEQEVEIITNSCTPIMNRLGYK